MAPYLLIFVFGLFVFYILLRDKRRNELISKIPGPPGLPVIGNLLMFNVSKNKLWGVMRELNKTYYPVIKFWLGPYPTVNICHPDDIEILLSSQKHLEKGSSYKCVHPWLKTGLLTSTGEKWQKRRKIITPAFHFKILKKYMEIVDDNGIRFTEVLRADNKETVQNLVSFCLNITMNIICESAMGIALDKIDTHSSNEYKAATVEMGNIIIYRILRPYIQDWMMNPLLKIGRIQKRLLGILHGFTNKVLIERKEYYKHISNKYSKSLSDDSEGSDSNNISIGRKKRLAMLDLLLSAQEDGLIDDDGIREEVDTFMFAGHDTTGMALVYTIMLLAEHKDIQTKARQEVVRVLTKSRGKISIAEIQELQYLERCIKESLRLFPPGIGSTRNLRDDLKLKNYVVPAGTEIVCHIYDLHRDPNFWPEPDRYDPDRFLPQRIQGRHPYSYIPFSAGPRNCIGQKFALMELKSLMASILYNFELEPVSRVADIELLMHLVARPSKPVFTKFIRIDNNDDSNDESVSNLEQ